LNLSILQRTERALVNPARHSSEQRAVLSSLVQDAHRFEDSLTHQIFQQLVLGSHQFTQTYHEDPFFETEGYLYTHDEPSLSPQETKKLKKWLEDEFHLAAVFTNRPCLAPGDFFDTPEAEIGLKVVDLEELPIIGHGSLGWLSKQHGLPDEYLLKPSPVHVLATLIRAVGFGHKESLLMAGELVLKESTEIELDFLDRAIVRTFEDAQKGIESTKSTKEFLSTIGIEIEIHLYGITRSEIKSRALQESGALVFSSLGKALNHAGVL
jgi:hypothetical protein